jgi:hypothetical protein
MSAGAETFYSFDPKPLSVHKKQLILSFVGFSRQLSDARSLGSCGVARLDAFCDDTVSTLVTNGPRLESARRLSAFSKALLNLWRLERRLCCQRL